mgnify:CR=1 FL=1
MPDPIVEEIKKSFEEFKATNNALIQAKADGKAVGDLEAKLAKIEAGLTKVTDQQAEALKSNERLAKIETALKRVNGNLEQAAGALTEAQQKHRELSLKAMRYGDAGQDSRGVSMNDVKQAAIEAKALSVNDDTGGGFMVHDDLSGRIVKRVFETSDIRKYAAVQSISSGALEGMIDADEASSGWVGETAARPATATPKINKYRIPVFTVYANPYCSQDLLDDAEFNPETWLAGQVADRLMRQENLAFVSGNGVNKPHGFLASDRTIVADSGITDDSFMSGKKIGYVPTGAAADFAPVPATGADPAQGDSLIQLMYALKTQYRNMPGTAWGMARATIGRVRRLRDSLGNYLWAPGLGAAPQTLLEFPIAEFNDMAAIGANAYPVAFANWTAAYQIVDRKGIRILRDPYTNKPNVQFYTTKRVGGDLINFEAIKVLKVATS